MAYKLFTTYYRDPFELRRRELDLCLALNMAAFATVHVLAEGVADPPFDEFRGVWDNWPTRPRFADALAVARESCVAADIAVIANCDIAIPLSSLEKIDAELLVDVAYCLTRWEIEGRYTMQVWDVGYSQDTWAFRGPPRPEIGGDYHFGKRGCDNRFSHELRSSGYHVQNPSKSIATLHLHATKSRTSTNTEAYRVPPPYLYLSPIELTDEQPMVEALTYDERSAAFAARKKARR